MNLQHDARRVITLASVGILGCAAVGGGVAAALAAYLTRRL